MMLSSAPAQFHGHATALPIPTRPTPPGGLGQPGATIGRVNALSERQRLAALFALDILQTPREAVLERLVLMMQQAMGLPSAALVLVDRSSAIFHTRIGTGLRRCPRGSWPCSRVVESGAPLVLTDHASARPGDAPLASGSNQPRAYIGVPLRSRDGMAVGTLCAFGPAPMTPPQPGQIRLAEQLAAVVVEMLELRKLATHDPLTGLHNRRGFMEHFERELRRCNLERAPLAIGILDIDHFKLVNDTWGHGAGDEVLRRIAGALAADSEEGVPIGRLGGEEFAVVLSGCDAAAAFRRAESLRLAVESLRLPELPDLRPSISIGLALHSPGESNASELLMRADSALYAAKLGGRNRVELAASPPPALTSPLSTGPLATVFPATRQNRTTPR